MTTTQLGSKVIISTQVGRDVRDKLERRAAAADRSLSAEVRRAINEHLERTDDETEEA